MLRTVFPYITIGVIDADTSCDIHPVGDFIGNAARKYIALAAVFARIAVGDPIGILHAQVAALALRPELCIDFACWVPAFECLYERKSSPRGKR